MNRLPYVPKAQPGESPLSVLRRSAINNGYKRVLALLHSLAPLIDHSIGMLGFIARNPALYLRLASLLGIKDRDINGVAYDRVGSAREDNLIWQGLTIPFNDLQFKTEKLCIPCFLEKGYALSEWDHKAAVGCKEHKVFLDEYCPVCHSPWTFDQEPLACGCDTSIVLKSLRPISLEQAALLSNIIDDKNQQDIEKLSIILNLISWWKRLGIEFTGESKSAFIFKVYHGQRPDLNLKTTGGRLHAQVLLMPLLNRSSDIANSIISSFSLHLPSNLLSSYLNQIEISRRETQTLLGTSRVRFNKFLKEGLIEENAKSRYLLNDINQLLLNSPWLPFDNAKQQLLHDSYPKNHSSLAQIIKAELKGIGSESVNVKQAKDKEPTNYLTIPEVAKKLNSNTESIRYLIKLGKILAEKGTPKSPVQWAILEENYDAFNEKFVFASAIARELNLPVTTTSSRLISAGIKPISGPGIDEARTFVFLRQDIKDPNIYHRLQGPYLSPAGRKAKNQHGFSDKYITSKELAKLLKIDTHQVRKVVSDRWIHGEKNSRGHYRFDQTEALNLVHRIDKEYIDVDIACLKLDMPKRSFRYTWIYSGYICEYSLGKRRFVTKNDFERISSLWSKYATSTYIARKLGRPKTFCINLEKIGLIEPVKTLGKGSSIIKLFPREHPLYQCYKAN